MAINKTPDQSTLEDTRTMRPIRNHARIAVICANGIGDGLTWMVMAYNLHKQGHHVSFFSNAIFGMRDWFPNVQIHKQREKAEDMASYDHLLVDDHSWYAKTIANGEHDARILIPYESNFNRKAQRIENMLAVLRESYGINEHSKQNGVTPLQGLKFRSHERRVAIHPTASDRARHWGKKKFIKLANTLMADGFEVAFIINPKEQSEWMDAEKEGVKIPNLNTLSDTSSYIYESAYFIGSDSGIGHLASNIGIPTISIFVRKSHSLNWRPGWSLGDVVSPYNIMPGRFLRQKIWRPLLPVSLVKNSFDKLIVDYENLQSGLQPSHNN